jgi:uroporphyrinogen decarboxylase
MVSRDRVIRALNHQSIDRAPRDLWLGPGLEVIRPDDLAEMNVRFPSDVLHLESKWPVGKRSKGHHRKPGPCTDAWGCGWELGDHGLVRGLTHSPLSGGGAAVAAYEPPTELLDPARFATINVSCEGSGRFALANTEIRPLGRLCQLRGSEAACAGLCDGNDDLGRLLGRLHEFYLKEIELWGRTQADGLILGDDLAWVVGSRTHLKIWRALFKPLFRDYCAAVHRHDKFVFFLCESEIDEALDDMLEIGVDAVHAHWSQDELERQAARYRNQVTFWGGVHPQKVQPPCNCGDIREAVFRVRKALDFGAGGVISQVHWENHVPLRNIVTFFEQWLIPLPVTV